MFCFWMENYSSSGDWKPLMCQAVPLEDGEASQNLGPCGPDEIYPVGDGFLRLILHGVENMCDPEEVFELWYIFRCVLVMNQRMYIIISFVLMFMMGIHRNFCFSDA